MHKNQKALMADVKAAIELQAETGLSFKDALNLFRYDFSSLRQAVDTYEQVLCELTIIDSKRYESVNNNYKKVKAISTRISQLITQK